MNEVAWKEIKCQKDIDEFMYNMSNFHDSCLKELRYESGAYVGENLSMMPVNVKRDVYVVLQMQAEKPSVVEILFKGVEKLNLKPVNENYTCEIFNAYMCIEDDELVWFDNGDFKDSYQELYEKDDTWIKAHKVFWRPINNWLGEQLVYGNIR